ncbi:MAG: beta-galactosidase [Chitinophaga sp.]|nr:beta-galactosidase [Chitinophaga sp.]
MLFLCCNTAIAQRDTIHLNDQWQFTTDKQSEGFKREWYLGTLPNARTVTIPHTWNIEDTNQTHYGWAWYQKRISIPATYKNKQTIIEFGAINHTAHIYLNGVKLAENIGDGFSKFKLDLMGKLKIGADNILTVAVNNDFGKNKVPFGNSFDWPNDGGMIRKVKMIVTNLVAPQEIFVTPTLRKDSSASVKIRLPFNSLILDRKYTRLKTDLKLTIQINAEDAASKANGISATITPEWDGVNAYATVSIPKVKPWHIDFPNLYQVRVAAMNDGAEIDEIATTVGFRRLEFINGQTHLNGERIKLMGVEWTAGSNPDYGFAETDSVILANCKLMKEVNAIFTRQHFQQDDLFYDFCDRNGILVQQEVPLWGPETPASEAVQQIAFSQLERMVSNMYNHPSIFSWGAGNELRARDADMKPFISALMKRSRELDPSRHTAYVSNTLTHGYITHPNFVPDAAAEGDYLMMNEYGGSWWSIPTGKIHLYLDSVHMSYPTKPFFISEFGLCEPNFKGGDERRVEDLIYHMAIYESKPYVEGAIYFDLTDYRTHYPGTTDIGKFRRRIHGVYDMYGKPKPSMKVLREQSTPIEIQHVSGWGKGKLNITLYGSMGLPQHTVAGYQLYISSSPDNYLQTKAYEIPTLKPGQRHEAKIDAIKGEYFITIVRPLGYIATQKGFFE